MGIINTADYVAMQRAVEVHSEPCNSALQVLHKDGGFGIAHDVHVYYAPGIGGGTVAAPIIEYTGAVRVINQYADLTSVTALGNCTDVYACLWDGVDRDYLTNGNPGGAVLTNFTVDSHFAKMEDVTQAYVAINADQARAYETPRKDAGYPFTILAKSGQTNQIRFWLTTTDALIDFWMRVYFDIRLLRPDSSFVFV